MSLTASSELLFVKLDLLEKDIDSGKIYTSAEALGIIGDIFDVFIKFSKNFLNMFKGIFTNFKRSELQEFIDSRVLRFNEFLKKNIDLSNHLVPIPSGMYKSYPIVVEYIKQEVDRMNLETLVDQIDALLVNMEKRQIATFQFMHGIVDRATKDIDIYKKDKIERELNKLFVDRNGNKMVKANSVLIDMPTINGLTPLILSFEDHYKRVSNNLKFIENIDERVGAIIDRMKVYNFGDKVFLSKFHSFIHTAAVQLDMYGVLIHEAQRIEHNFVLALNMLMSKSP